MTNFPLTITQAVDKIFKKFQDVTNSYNSYLNEWRCEKTLRLKKEPNDANNQVAPSKSVHSENEMTFSESAFNMLNVNSRIRLKYKRLRAQSMAKLTKIK